MEQLHSNIHIMEDERSSSPSSVASSYEETDSKSLHLNQPIFNSPFWFAYASAFNSIRPTTPIVRHNFKSIEELLSPNPTSSRKNDDTGYNSQLSLSLQSQETDDDDNIENLKPTVSSTPCIKKTKKIRTAFTDDQKQYLDRFYSTNRYPDPTQMETLSCLLSLDEKVIRVWFQNKRSREKTHPRNYSNPSATNFLH